MGRHKLAIDESTVLALRSEGKTIKEISDTLGVSTATLTRRIAELKYMKGILSKYRELQGLQLTELQFRVLEAITPEKLDRATLLELVRAFAVLVRVEKRFRTEPSIKFGGRLVDYLLLIEEEEKLVAQNMQRMDSSLQLI